MKTLFYVESVNIFNPVTRLRRGFIAPFTKILLGNLWGQNGISFQPAQEENAICRLGMTIYNGALAFAKEAKGSFRSLSKYYERHIEVGSKAEGCLVAGSSWIAVIYRRYKDWQLFTVEYR
ncbi:hypothetical protein TNCV_3342461 [Trichonephila clavipes]|nr:hypothetical protein TNCV_3342461 [Trichonephila clavipes]